MPTDSSEVLVLTFLTMAGAATALTLVLVAYLVQAGRRRAGLAPAAVSLSLVGPVCGIGAASKHLAQTFADMANAGGGGTAVLVAGCTRAENLMRLGDMAAIVTLLLAAGLGWLNTASPRRSDRSEASATRLCVLLALFVLPVVIVGGLHEHARATNRIAVQVAQAPAANPGEPGEGPSTIETLVSRMTKGIYLGVLGSPVLLVLLAALALTSALLAWNIEPPPWFRATATVLLLLTAAFSAAGILLFERPVVLSH